MRRGEMEAHFGEPSNVCPRIQPGRRSMSVQRTTSKSLSSYPRLTRGEGECSIGPNPSQKRTRLRSRPFRTFVLLLAALCIACSDAAEKGAEVVASPVGETPTVA